MNNRAKPADLELTDDEIEALALKHIAPGYERLRAVVPEFAPYQQSEQFRRVKALIGDVLSKLRAPVADERAAFEKQWEERPRFRGDQSEKVKALYWWQARAALASATVADHGFKIWKNSDNAWWNCRARLGVGGQGLTPEEAVRDWAARNGAKESAPVAGEAQAGDYVQSVPGHCDRIVWRGQYYALPLDAAPQASAEDVRLRELLVRCQAWMLSSEHDRPNMLIALIQDALQSQPQADKDGGQQRAEVAEAQCVAVYQALDEFGRDIDMYEFGLPYLGVDNRQQKVVEIIRAALSATQAGQGFTACVFDGPAPDGYASWLAWCTTPVKSGAFIRAARVDDWVQPTEDGGNDE